MKNYMRFKIMGGHIIMKPDVVPHKFDCQINSVPDICTSRKRGHRKLLLDEVGDDNALGVASASAAASRLFEPTLIYPLLCLGVFTFYMLFEVTIRSNQ